MVLVRWGISDCGEEGWESDILDCEWRLQNKWGYRTQCNNESRVFGKFKNSHDDISSYTQVPKKRHRVGLGMH